MLTKMRKLRQELGIRQQDIANDVGCTSQFISAIETGKNVLSYDMARQIARYLGTTPDVLFLEDFRRIEKDKKKEEREWL